MNCNDNKFRLMVVQKMFIDNNTNRGGGERGGGINLSTGQNSSYDIIGDGQQLIWSYPPRQRMNNASSSTTTTTTTMIKNGDCSVEALMMYLLYLIYIVMFFVITYWLNIKIVEMRRNRRRIRQHIINNLENGGGGGGNGSSSNNDDLNKNTADDYDVELGSLAATAASVAFSAAGLGSAPTTTAAATLLPQSPYSQPIVTSHHHKKLPIKKFINSLGIGGDSTNSSPRLL
jgi:hypothetical protein